jgi:hypothetical protein
LGGEGVKSFNATLPESPSHGYLFRKYCVKKEKIIEAIDEAGGEKRINMG